MNRHQKLISNLESDCKFSLGIRDESHPYFVHCNQIDVAKEILIEYGGGGNRSSAAFKLPDFISSSTALS